MPLSRLSVCLKCSSELYVCLMCRFHDPKLNEGCREERAEHVKEKAHANFCDYFALRSGAYQAKDETPTTKARSELDVLFGAALKPESAGDPAQAELDKLFGKKP
jgi:hypothetical protein